MRVLKVRCPSCGDTFTLEVRPELLAEAAASPIGLAGLAVPHGDHVMVVYVDSSGGERGVRVFKSLLVGVGKGLADLTVPPTLLAGLRNIGGFVAELGKLGIRLRASSGAAAVTLRARKGGTSLELEFTSDVSYQAAKPWLELFLDVVDTSYSNEPLDYVNAVRVLDLLLEEKPFTYARQILWLLTNSSTITVRMRAPEMRLVRELRPSLLFERYNGNFIARVLESGGLRLSDLLASENPQLLLSSAEAVLALYRRGVVDLVVE